MTEATGGRGTGLPLAQRLTPLTPPSTEAGYLIILISVLAVTSPPFKEF